MITSTSNQQVKNLIQLKKKSKARKEQRLFLVEGIRMFGEAPKELIKKIYVSETFFNRHKDMLKDRKYEIFSDQVFDYVSDTKTPQGILCVLQQPFWSLEDMTDTGVPCLLVLEGIQDPGNLGTMFRSGEGAGISGILMDSGTVDLFNPKTIRSTMGSIYRVPFLQTDDLQSVLGELKNRGIMICAAHLEGSCCYDEPDYRKPCAFLIGNEGNGLTEETAALADTRIRIPMEGMLESLNAAVAASLLMYEAGRQRRKG